MKKTGYTITSKGIVQKQVALRMFKHEDDAFKFMAEKECMGWSALARVLVLEAMQARGVTFEKPAMSSAVL